MPPRLNKRQQREQEELAALQAQGPPDFSEGEEEDAPIKPVSLGFAALSASGNADDAEDDEDEEPAMKSGKKSKKKKKKGTSTPSAQVQSNQPSPSPRVHPSTPPVISKKADKKAKARQKKADNQTFESALAELAIKYPDMQDASSSSGSQSTSSIQFARLLAVSLPRLNSDAELRKFFGSKVVDANRPQPTVATGRRGRRVIAVTEVQRSNLTTPKPEWARARQQREGLSLRALSKSELKERRIRRGVDPDAEVPPWAEKDIWWTVEYNKRYKRLTRRFMQVVASGDPAAFYQILWNFPWHVDTILQQAEIARHREEHSVASELLSRALFSYEHPLQLSPWSFTSGLNRLDFDHVENRPLFLALHRHIIDITRRGLLKTGFEFSKLLYGLDPREDPHGALFWLDWLSVKASMRDWFLEMFDLCDKREQGDSKRGSYVNPSVLPGWLYTRALILKMQELDAEKKGKKYESKVDSSTALVEAINNFPQVVPLLTEKIDVSLPSEKRNLSEYKILSDSSGLSSSESIAHLLSHLYVQRAHGVWKDPEISRWFSSVLSSTSPSSSFRPRYKTFQSLYTPLSTNQNLIHSVYRHVITYLQSSSAPNRSLMGFIPSSDPILANSLACDPVPPVTRVNAYDTEYFKDVDWGSSEGAEADREQTRRAIRAFERLFGDARHVQPLLEQHPEIAHILEAINEGEVDLVDVLNDALMQAAGGEGRVGPGGGEGGGALPDVDGGAGAMPGGPNMFNGMDLGIDFDEGEDFPGEEGEADEEDEDEDEGEGVSAPFRMIRNVVNRFWGGFAGGTTADAEEDSDSDGGGGGSRNADD